MSAGTRIFVAGLSILPTEDVVWPTGDWVVREDHGTVRLLPGVVSVGGRLVVALPRCYGSASAARPASATTHAVALFVASLARYARDCRSGLVDDPSFEAQDASPLVRVGEADDLIDQLEASLLLWEDHQQNGPLAVSVSRVHEQVPGRVLWGRALRQGAPIESPSGVVFRQLPRSTVSPDPRHALTALHKATCAAIGARFGFGLVDHDEPIDPASALRCIEENERLLSADRPRRLLGWLRRYYGSRAGGTHKGGHVHGLFVRRYEYLWEHMLRVVLRDEGRGAAFRGEYRLPDGGRVRGLDLRPDVVMRSRSLDGREVTLVLDAKDYAEDAWPASADLSKQILYRLLISNLVDPLGPDLGLVGNAFLFPALVSGTGVIPCGTHDITGTTRQGSPGRVVGLDVDTERVSEAYVAGRSGNELRAAITEAVLRN